MLFFKKKKLFERKSITLIKMLTSSNLFIWHLSREILRKESAGNGVAIGKSWAVLGRKRDRWQSVICVQPLSSARICLSAEGEVRSFDKSDIIEKITIRNHFFVNFFSLSFHLSAFKVTFIKTCNPRPQSTKKIVFNLKIVHKWCSLIDPFPANYCLAFFYSDSFSCTCFSYDSSCQVSDEKL